jgi:hypothetical protein
MDNVSTCVRKNWVDNVSTCVSKNWMDSVSTCISKNWVDNVSTCVSKNWMDNVSTCTKCNWPMKYCIIVQQVYNTKSKTNIEYVIEINKTLECRGFDYPRGQWISFNPHNPSGRITGLDSAKWASGILLEEKRGRRVMLATSPPSVWDISQFYRPPRPVTGTALFPIDSRFVCF